MPASLTQEELDALISLLNSCQPNLLPPLQTAAVKLQAARLSKSFLQRPSPSSTPVRRSSPLPNESLEPEFSPSPSPHPHTNPSNPLTFENSRLRPRTQELEAAVPTASRITIRIPPRAGPPSLNDRENREQESFLRAEEALDPSKSKKRPLQIKARQPAKSRMDLRGAVRRHPRKPKHTVLEEDSSEEEGSGPMARNRRTLNFLSTAVPIPETQTLATKPKHFFLSLKTACDNILASREENAVSRLMDAIQGQNTFVAKISSTLADDSLENLTLRCFITDQNALINDFNYMICTMHLRVKIFSEMKKGGKSLNSVLESVAGQGKRSLSRYFVDGGKFWLLAAAGTIFLLMVVAGAKLRAKVRDQELTEDVLLRLLYLIRCPTEDELGQGVVASIIPVIALLRQRYRLKFSSLFSPSVLPNALKEENRDPDISDLELSDHLFNSTIFKAILKPRNKESWSSCYTPISAGSERAPEDALAPLPLVVVDTEFDFCLKENSSTAGRFKINNKKESFYYTQSQRKFAEQAVRTNCLVDVQDKLKSHLASGKRPSQSAYVEINHAALEGHRLRVNAKDGQLGVIVLPDMPEHLRSNLMNALKLTFPDKVKARDSRTEKQPLAFPSLHFSWYNKYCLQGKNSQAEEEPAAYEARQQSSTGKGKRVKTAFTMPYTTSELQEYMEEYLLISQTLAPVFEWIFTALSKLLPSEMEIISQFAEVLPANAESLAGPFAGFVINFNIAANIHRDKDCCLCVVLVVSENCKGGDLCLEELGIKLSLRNGDIAIFPSQKISHFNVHFTGERASIVFHTDATNESWVKHRNFWDRSFCMLESE